MLSQMTDIPGVPRRGPAVASPAPGWLAPVIRPFVYFAGSCRSRGSHRVNLPTVGRLSGQLISRREGSLDHEPSVGKIAGGARTVLHVIPLGAQLFRRSERFLTGFSGFEPVQAGMRRQSVRLSRTRRGRHADIRSTPSPDICCMLNAIWVHSDA